MSKFEFLDDVSGSLAPAAATRQDFSAPRRGEATAVRKLLSGQRMRLACSAA